MTVTATPPFLRTPSDLQAHLEAHFDGLDGGAKGAAFLRFAEQLIPFTDVGGRFEGLEPSAKVSHDLGVDMTTHLNDDGERLCVQSKYRVVAKDDLDTVFSKFQNYERELVGVEPEAQQELFGVDDQAVPNLVFMLITASTIDGLLARYEKSALSSRRYYDGLRRNNRIHIVHAPDIHRIVSSRFRSAYLGPPEVRMRAVGGWVEHGPVRLGTVRGADLARLYQEHGDGLFFENIRSFLGGEDVSREDRETVNQRIVRTIREEPQRMLERNNGIVIKASTVAPENEEELVLRGAAIVNGCQTTVCLHEARDQIQDSCMVLVKVVETDEGWDIAHAANYQNEVTYFDLQLAKYLRPQAVEKAASETGYSLRRADDVTSDVAQLLSALYGTHVGYSEVRLIYIGLFSRSPQHLFDSNYSKLRSDVLEVIYEQPGVEDQIFEMIFQAVVAGTAANEECEKTFDAEVVSLFRRFSTKVTYRAYLVVLTLCGALGVNLSERRSDTAEEAKRMRAFLEDARELLENDVARFHRTYLQAYIVLAERAMQVYAEEGDEESVRVSMHGRLKGAFTPVYFSLKMRMMSDEVLH